MNNWKNLDITKKVVSVCNLGISVFVIVAAILQLCGVWEDAGMYYMLPMGVCNILNAYLNWKDQKGTAKFQLICGIIIIICAVIVIALNILGV